MDWYYWQNLIKGLEDLAAKPNSYPPMIIYTWALSKHQQRSFAAVHLETIKARRAFFDKT
ncbi:MAG: hypothetical protein GY810_05920 [Aureispira sp.]|nr:hypothetical protein [Aureispira sp.]